MILWIKIDNEQKKLTGDNMNKLFPFAIYPSGRKLVKSEQSPEDYEKFVQKMIRSMQNKHGSWVMTEEMQNNIRKALDHSDLRDPNTQQNLLSILANGALATHVVGNKRIPASNFEDYFTEQGRFGKKSVLNYHHPVIEGLRDIHYGLERITPPLPFPESHIDSMKKIKGLNLTPEDEDRLRENLERVPRPTHPSQSFMDTIIKEGLLAGEMPRDNARLTEFAQTYPGFDAIRDAYRSARNKVRTIDSNDPTAPKSFYLGTTGRNGEKISGLEFIPSHRTLQGQLAWKMAVHSPRTLLPEHAKGGLVIPLHTDRLGEAMSFIRNAGFDQFDHPGLATVAASIPQTYGREMRLDYGSHSNPNSWASHIAPQLVNRPGVVTRIMTIMDPQNAIGIDNRVRNLHAARQQSNMGPPR